MVKPGSERSLKRVVLIIPSEMGYFGGVLGGVVSYLQNRNAWDVRVVSFYHDVSALVTNWQPHGIIGAVDTWQWADTLALTGRPVVNISHVKPSLAVPRVGLDELQIGRLAAGHFLERAFRQFAFVGHAGLAFSDERGKGFCEALRAVGHDCNLFDPADYAGQGPTDEDNLGRWIESLPRPVALLACNDGLAMTISRICQRIGVRIPDDVALLGVDDAELICGLATPPLSSIATAPQRIGFAAAELLDRLMDGAPAPQGPVLFPPVRVVTRQSTDTVAADDPDVAQAVRFIRDHAFEPIGVPDVLREVPLSRRMLERRFLKTIGRGLQQEIQRVRIERAKDLLSRLDLPIYEVAERCGFGSPQRLWAAFRTHTGETPRSFRTRLLQQSPIAGAERADPPLTVAAERDARE